MRVVEREALKSGAIKKELSARGIRLCTFRQLATPGT
jgi:hypothetical protein